MFDCFFVANNQGTKYGGNIEIEYVSTPYLWIASISILNSEISHCRALVKGGLYMAATVSSGTLLTIKNAQFLQNSALFIAAAVPLEAT